MSNGPVSTTASAPSMMLATGLRPTEQIVLGSGVLPDETTQRALLQAVFAWNALDYILRIALKRLRKLSIDDPRMLPVMTGMQHSAVMKAILDELRASADARLPEVEKIFGSVGGRQDSGSLYDRRNHAIHSIFAHTRDGDEIFRRIGHTDYTASSPVTPDFLAKLAGEIGATIDRLNTLIPA